MVKAGKNQAAAKAFVAKVLSSAGPGEAAGSGVRQAVSTAASSGASDRDAAMRGRGVRRSGVSPSRSPTALVIAVVMAFLLVPIVALITYQPVGDLIDGFGTKVATDAIVVSLKTNGIAFALMIAFGTPFAYIIGRSRFRGRSLVITLVELPLVMPPAVAGLALLVAFGRFGLLGHTLSVLGIDLAFTQAAVVIAILFVASPFYLRGAIAAFEAVDETLLDVAGTLGAGPVRRMLRVAIPLAGGGARGGRGGRVRARDRRVRRDDPVRRQLPGDHPDAAARRLLPV